MELTPELTWFASVILTPIVAQLVKWVLAATGWRIHRGGITLLAFAEALILSFVFIQPTLPSYTDPMAFAIELVVLAGSVLGFANLLYNLVLERLFELLGLVPAG